MKEVEEVMEEEEEEKEQRKTKMEEGKEGYEEESHYYFIHLELSRVGLENPLSPFCLWWYLKVDNILIYKTRLHASL